LRDLIERRKKGKTITIEDDKGNDPRGSNVVDLMAALKKSLGAGGGTGGASAASPKKPAAKKTAAQKKAAARPAPKASARKRA
jgi:DNA end-binding protein Ku